MYTIATPFPVERIFGGKMLGARGSNFLVFYGWNSGDVIKKIDVTPTVSTFLLFKIRMYFGTRMDRCW